MEKPELKLIGADGNAFGILSLARRVALKNGMDWAKIEAEATKGDYDNLLNVMMNYFTVI
jgi:hypothetical protein